VHLNRTTIGRPVRVRLLATAALTLYFVLLSAPANAHGIGSDAADRSVWGFAELGITHMLLGWDHLLFIGGVVVLAGEWRRAAKLITVFVVGHSITLIVASLAGWRVDPGWVDVVIALSLVFVGGVAMFGRPKRWDYFGGAVYVFGLIHGLGLASRLAEAGLPEDGLLWRVIAFNVGIEMGQLTAIFVMVGVATLIKSAVGEDRHKTTGQLAAASLLLVGVIAGSVITTQQLDNDEGDLEPVAADACSVAERTQTFPGTGGHAAKNFYGPTETAPLGDFGHSLGDGYVVVLYPADLPSDQLQQLEGYVTGPKGRGVLAGPDPEADVVTATNAYETLTCPGVRVDELNTFTTEWLESISG
jgi:hydrogenase/urease accessory protein HupE